MADQTIKLVDQLSKKPFRESEMKYLAAFILLLVLQTNVNADNLFNGRVAVTRSDLAAYTGLNAVDRINGEWRKKAYVFNYEQLAVNYGENVDFQLRKEQIILCWQTEKLLYSKEMIPVLRYKKGTRPILEKAVAKAIANCRTEQDKALAIMRFCRDLKLDASITHNSPDWQFGGTEEELIAKHEDLCETLGRLYVALCEIAGLPARIVMHDIGGHITAEVYADGKWGYIDPRFGIYFLKKDGKLASVRELCKDRSLFTQSAAVQKEVGGKLSWQQRAESCRDKYFAPKEINGFEYYSLADSEKYRYDKLTRAEAVRNGLFRINKIYAALISEVFTPGKKHIRDYFWDAAVPLKKLPMMWRNDGFSPWFEMKPPITPEYIKREHVDLFRNSNVDIMMWGTGPGSTFTHRTKAGEIFGYCVTDKQWETMFRRNDRYVHENIKSLINQNIDPQALIVKLGHESGVKVYSRLEMNHEYAPASDKNWLWLAFVGEFNKKNPQFRIPRTTHLDYKYKEVRDFRLAILRELVQAGVDGIELDFVVYPPFFAKPDPAIMTGFMRQARAIVDEESKKQNKKIILVAAMTGRTANADGLDWQRWMREKLIDGIIVGHKSDGPDRAEFDIRLSEFVRHGKANNIPVYARLFQSLLIFARDSNPDGKARYSRHKNGEEYRAQALMSMRDGADIIKLAHGSNREWRMRKAMYNELGDPALIEFSNKNYLVDPFPELFPLHPEWSADKNFYTNTRSVHLRIADDLAAAQKKNKNPEVFVQFNVRPLQAGEKIEVYLNGNGPMVISGDDPAENSRNDANSRVKCEEDIMVPNWWRRGIHTLKADPKWFYLGENIIRIVYSADKSHSRTPLYIQWPEVQIRYGKQQ